MDDKLFIIAIGGTGMRCLESFVHLCAAGMFDNQTIDILTLDTDQSNGNKGRAESLIELYNKVKTNDAANEGGEPRKNTFFSAKLNLYRFFTDYSTPERRNFSLLASTRNLPQDKRDDNRDLSDLFFDHQTVQQFPLDHGYRAQTHLGSLLMYHGIVEAAIKAKKGGPDVKAHERELQEFLQLLNANASNARVFVFGSVFGGTGASSIPVIPIALRDALKVLTSGNNDLNLKKVKFGSTLLTDYFTFDMPDDKQMAKDKVVADANNFAINSQAALNFYNSDLTVENSYKLLYHIGWPSGLKINYSENHRGDVVTGGNAQKNACHVVELMCACAAYDFFKRENLDNPKVEYLFRTVEEAEHEQGQVTLRLTGSSFVGDKQGPHFEQKLGSLLSFAHLILSKYKGSEEGKCGTIEFRKDIGARNITDYQDMPDEQARQIDNYLKEFAYKILNGNLVPGWIFQIYSSIKGGAFIFSGDALMTDVKKLKEVDPGAIYADDKYNWQKKGIFGSAADKRLDAFIDVLKGKDAVPSSEQGVTLKEKFLGHAYNAIVKSQKQSHLTT